MSLFPQALEELKMSGSIASYDQLVRQVEALKKENTHLRRELEDNSSHLSKLENETSDMKVKALPAPGPSPLSRPLLSKSPKALQQGGVASFHLGFLEREGGLVGGAQGRKLGGPVF